MSKANLLTKTTIFARLIFYSVFILMALLGTDIIILAIFANEYQIAGQVRTRMVTMRSLLLVQTISRRKLSALAPSIIILTYLIFLKGDMILAEPAPMFIMLFKFYPYSGSVFHSGLILILK